MPREFRIAHDHLAAGQRAGLVGTNTIRQNYSRTGGLDYIVAQGGTIVEAVSSMKWSGDAVVFVSIVNWIKGQAPGKKRLYTQQGNDPAAGWSFKEVEKIGSALSFETDVTLAVSLRVNAARGGCFQGQTHGHEGFLLSAEEAAAEIAVDPKNVDVLFPYLIANELIGRKDGMPTRYVIDFQARTLLQAQALKSLFGRIKHVVLPDRERAAEEEDLRNSEAQKDNPNAKVKHHHENFLRKWWLLSYPRSEMLQAIAGLHRYIACGRVTARPIFEFINQAIRPNDALMVFPYDDDYSFGVFQSGLHWTWFTNRCSTLKGDPRYTSNTVFDSFPWPQEPSLAAAKKVADTAVHLRTLRYKLKDEHGLSFRELYRALEMPGASPLKDAHAALDQAVRDAYGMSKADDVLAFLLDLNQTLASAEAKGLAVTGPGLPSIVKNRAPFVTIVAENGAVVAFPDTGYSKIIGEPPAPELLEGLRSEGIPFDSGQVIIEAAANDSERILAVVRRLELPLSLLFNRGRVMLLPQAISKATGIVQALTILRLSPHNAIAIGDAENDHELLRACEMGVAVAWGSEALKRTADYVLPGAGPAAVADYIKILADRKMVPAPVKTRRRLLLGHTDDGRPLALAVRGRNVLVAGDTKSGKSWVAGLLCEQLILYGYCLCILDPEGDYVSLKSLPGVVVFGGADPLPRPRDLLRALRHPDVSVVIDLSHTPHDEKLDYLRTVLPSLATLRRHTGLPHRIVVDEAHYFLKAPDVLSLLDLELNGYTLVTYRASTLHPEILAASQAIIVTCESDSREVQALATLCASCEGVHTGEWPKLLGNLVLGEAVVLPITEEAEGEARRIRLAPRLTPHVRHLSKYVDLPVSHRRAFVFSDTGAGTRPCAATLREFVAVVEGAASATIDDHLRKGDFSRWIADVFGDYPLAREVARLEKDYRTGAIFDIGEKLGQAVRERYEFIEPGPPSRPWSSPQT